MIAPQESGPRNSGPCSVAGDGLTLALINPINAMEPILNPDLAKFDARQFKWIGSMNSEVGTMRVLE